MRVLLVNKFHWPKGGSETYHFAVGESLEQMGHEVAWFAMDDPKNLPCRQSHYFVSSRDYTGRTSPLNKLRDGLALIYSPEAKSKFNDLLEEFRPDVIHLNLVHRQITLSILDAPYLAKNRVPVVWTSHDYIAVCPSYLMLDGAGEICDDCLSGGFFSCVRKHCVKGSRAKSALAALEARFLRTHGSYQKIDRIIAPSEFMRRKLLEGGFPSSQVICMCNFAKDTVLECARTKEDLTDHDHPYLLFFGRLSREKGIDVLVEAFLSIANHIPNWRLVIAGEGPERGATEEQVAGHPEGSRVELVGFQQGDALKSYVERASLAIASSRWREVLSYSNMEALAFGTPVICSEIGGMPELVLDGVTGFLCIPNDVASLAEAILRGVSFCGDQDAYRAMQSRCRSFVLENCDQTQYMENLVFLYRELIEERSGGANAQE